MMAHIYAISFRDQTSRAMSVARRPPAGNDEGRPCGAAFRSGRGSRLSALAGLEAALGLVDDVDPALPANDATVAVPVLERAERVPDLHGSSPKIAGAVAQGSCSAGFPAVSDGGRYWDRTSDPYDVNVVLYR